VPPVDDRALLFIGSETDATTSLASALDPTTQVTTPEMPATSSWTWDWAPVIEQWRAQICAGPPMAAVVVCTWPSTVEEAAVVELSPDRWRSEVEWPLALWFHGLAAATTRCVDGGSVVAVVELPAAIDCLGHGPVVAVADGVLALVRSLAAAEGGRGVRVNAVTTELFTVPAVLRGAPPPLPSFPGSVEQEVAGAVRLLLSADAAGLTGTTLRATGGRP
jgi:NAD(P)-dependent dehydrogenase (short-subunit alcohol dehydrogenase family)